MKCPYCGKTIKAPTSELMEKRSWRHIRICHPETLFHMTQLDPLTKGERRDLEACGTHHYICLTPCSDGPCQITQYGNKPPTECTQHVLEVEYKECIYTPRE